MAAEPQMSAIVTANPAMAADLEAQQELHKARGEAAGGGAPPPATGCRARVKALTSSPKFMIFMALGSIILGIYSLVSSAPPCAPLSGLCAPRSRQRRPLTPLAR